ncbi:MAG: bifunctional hydroxymethylpyrimidine kinase/phosphomethylpyrimidine kinase, partial [Thermoprotei archaeon]
KIESKEDMIKSAKEISKLGPKAVVIKGGHLTGEETLDILFYENKVYEFTGKRYDVKTTHGTGCSFSAAITAELAKGRDIISAVKTAKELISLAIRYGIPIGKGYGPVNPMAIVYREASRLQVIESIEEALRILKSEEGIHELIPEVGMNIAEAVPYATDENDIAAIPGRIRTSPLGDIYWNYPRFGASSHLARYILRARRYDKEVRAAINIRFNTRFIEATKELGYRVSYYDRREEPPEVKAVEGMTVQWGVDTAVKRIGCMPDVIFHRGDWGKEPMIVVFGYSAIDAAKKIVRIWRKIK